MLDLAYRYALAVDSRDAQMLASVFTSDGVMCGRDGSVRYRGAPGCATMIAEVAASFRSTMHNVFNQTFEIDHEGTVTGQTTGVASHLLAPLTPDGPLRLLDFAMRYHNRYAGEGALWTFAERRLEVVWTEWREVQAFDPAMLGRELSGFEPSRKQQRDADERRVFDR